MMIMCMENVRLSRSEPRGVYVVALWVPFLSAQPWLSLAQPCLALPLTLS
jgi:hypothetical protein